MDAPAHANARFGLLEPAQLAAMSGLDFLQALMEGKVPAPPFADVADVYPVKVEKGRVTFAGTPSGRFYNPMGTVHGGWTALLLDTAMGCAVHSALPAGHAYTTIDMTTTFVRALREADGPVSCEGVLLHRGGQIASAEGKVLDGRGRLIAHGTETCLIRSLPSSRT